MFKDAHAFVTACDRCQHTGNISRRNEMPLQNILEVELFDVWGIDFMGHFPSSYNNKYILLAVDYVSKWIEAIATPTKKQQITLHYRKTLQATKNKSSCAHRLNKKAFQEHCTSIPEIHNLEL